MAEEEEAEEPTKEKETQVEEGDVRVATAAGKKAGERMTQKERKRKRLVAKLAKQLLFNTAYLLLALCSGIRGPTLLDLQQIYKTNLRTISLSLVTASVGGVMGSLSAGLLMGRFPNFKYLITFEFVAGISLTTMVLPRLEHLWIYFVFMVLNGAHAAAMHTALHVLCLDIWRGSKSGPAIHSLHTVFSIGAFLSPVISRPFLSVEVGGGSGGDGSERRVVLNSTVNAGTGSTFAGVQFSESHIGVVYLVCGASLLAVSLGFLYLGARELRKSHRIRTKSHERKPPPPAPVYGRTEKILIIFTTVGVLCFIGGEFGIFNFLPAFAVKSDLGLTKAQGVNILAVYFLTYAFSRISCFFLTFCIPPRYLLVVVNLSFMIVGNTILLICAQKSALFVVIGYGVLGFGSGSMFGNVLLWLEEHFEVSSRVTSLLAISAGIGVNLAPLVVGQTIEYHPMVLIYLQVFAMCVAVWMYATVTWVGRDTLRENQRRKKRIREEKKRKKKEEEEEEEEEEKVELKVNGGEGQCEMAPKDEEDEDVVEDTPLKKDLDEA